MGLGIHERASVDDVQLGVRRSESGEDEWRGNDLSWRKTTDRLKHSQAVLKFADWLGRGRGRMRWLDHLHSVVRPRKIDLVGWEKQRLGAAWIGHATVLVRIGGMTVLTDPVLG